MSEQGLNETDHEYNSKDEALFQIETEQLRIVEEDIDSTRRMKSLCENAKQAGLDTLVRIDEQGEQIEAINTAMNQINEDMRDAEKNLQGMEKCCGLCVLPWNKSKNVESTAGYKDLWGEGKEDGAIGNGPRPMIGEQMQVGGNYITRIRNDALEEEMEENMADVNNMVVNLRNMAVDMGNEVEIQNRQLDRIKAKAGSNEMRVREANQRTEKLMKK